MSTILVTGAAGFIGSHVAERLLRRGDHVVGFDDLNDFYPRKYKNRNLRLLLSYSHFEFIQGSICNQGLLREMFAERSFRGVAHLAARAGVRPSIESPQDYVTTNIQGTLNLLEAAREYPPDNFVFTSSSSVYGDGGSKPFSEDHTPSDRPVSPYAATKKAGELLCHTYHHLHHLNINIVRPFTVYGPRGRPDMAPWKFLSAALEGRPIVQYGDGNTARDYTFIDDFVAGYVAALDNVLGFEIFNLGNAQAVTLKDLLRTLAVVTGRELNVICEGMQSGDVAATLSNNEKASRLLGYSPNVSIANGMRRFLEWYWQSFSATTDKSNHSLLRRAG